MDASRLWSRAVGRVRQRESRAEIQAGGDGWSMEQSWGGRRAGFGQSPAGMGSTHETEQSQERRCSGQGPCEAAAEGGEMQSCSAGIDKALFER